MDLFICTWVTLLFPYTVSLFDLMFFVLTYFFGDFPLILMGDLAALSVHADRVTLVWSAAAPFPLELPLDVLWPFAVLLFVVVLGGIT